MTASPAQQFSDLPRPLVIGLGVVLLQAVVMVGLTVLELWDFSTARATLVLSTAAVFALWAALLVACAWGLARLNSVARAPLVMAQLIHLGVAWNLRPVATLWLAVPIALSAVVVIVSVVNPRTNEVLT